MRGATRWMAGAGSIVAAGVALAGCFPPPQGAAPMRYRDDLPGVTVTKTANVVYSTAQDGTANDLHLDVYRPTPDTESQRPLVLLVHGGSFITGTKKNAKMVALATEYAKRGYVAASIDYRLLGQRGTGCDDPNASCVTAVLAAQHDAQAAIRYLRAHAASYGIDPTRVAIQGGSAGGGTALLVGLHSDDPGSSGTPGEDSSVRASIPISGGVAPASLAALEPYMNSGDAPTYLLYGTHDPSQPVSYPEGTAADLNAHGVPAFTLPLDGGHVPSGPDVDQIEEDQTAYFMYYMLDLAHAHGQAASAAHAEARQIGRLRTTHPALAREVEKAARH